MSYVALYRAYRPSKFSEVAGQKHITTTLQNALKNQKLGHSYLFNGPRGTGKTSIAKIVAKTINCETYPTNEPCNVCDTCLGISNGSISDVIEFDAASNNKVEEIRVIIDKVKYLPSVGKYKVYIIDEVHMLTTHAFNALLKTLEEPPAHVIFILATTDPHKIPSTIISRCQRFDFRGVSINEMTLKIKEIVARESIKIEEDAILSIAEHAEGGMRDALSLLDLAISFSDDGITLNDINIISGNISSERSLDIIKAIHENNTVGVFDVISQLIEDGKEVYRIIANLLEVLRDLLMAKNITLENVKKSIFNNEKFIFLQDVLQNQMIYHYIDVLVEAQSNIKFSSEKRTLLEVAILKMMDEVENAQTNEYILVDQLKKKVEDLEYKLTHLKVNPTLIDGEESVILEEEEVNVMSPFTIETIEDLLNNGDKDFKAKLQSAWPSLKDKKEREVRAIALELHRGELVAIGRKQMLVVFDMLATCNRLMLPRSKEIILKIFNSKQELVKNFYAIPRNVWDVIKNDFVTKLKAGESKPKLNKEIDLQVIVNKDAQDFDERSELHKLAISLFGENKVKIQEE